MPTAKARNKGGVSARYRNPATGQYDYTLVEKDERCRLVKCPNAGSGNPKCEQCTGPIHWTDHNGVEHGMSQSCHGCPMNGLGVPVCFAGCKGPNPLFNTDGKSIVTIGSMEDPSGFLEKERLKDPTKPEKAERRVSYDPVTATLRRDEENVAAAILRAMLRLGSWQWAEFKALASSDGRGNTLTRMNDRRAAARLISVAKDAFLKDESPACRIVRELLMLDGEDWVLLRERMREMTGASSARRMLVTKQAISARETRIAAKCPWYERMISELRRAGERNVCPKGGIPPVMRTEYRK